MTEDWEHEGDDEAAIDEVCVRLERAREWVDADRRAHAIVGGAVDGDRIAWVERSELDAAGGWEDIDYTLRVTVDGAPVLEWIVDTYNPYFGCDVGHLRFAGEGVVLVYREKHITVVAFVEFSGAVKMRALGDRWCIVGDQLLWHSETSRGLIERLHLPDLVIGLPLPRRLVDAHLAAATPLPGPEPRAVDDPCAMQSAIVRHLFGATPPTPLAGLLVGALAHRFWAADIGCDDRYDQLARMGEWNDPYWLPFYWQQTLGDEQTAGAVITTLEQLAARPPTTPDRGEHGWRIELACRHIAERCGELAATCRAGHLPKDVHCYFWAEWSQAGFSAGPRAGFPADLWRAWESLRPHASRLGSR